MTIDESRGLSRRALLQTGAAVGAGAALASIGAGSAAAATPAVAAHHGRPAYPQITDTSHASRRAAEIFRGFFTAKSEHQPDAMMTYFSKSNAYYIDATSGSVWPSWDSLNDVFHAFLPGAPATAISYPIRIVGDEHSAMVEFEDTQQLFGHELRILGSVTFDRRGKIVRWIDYWDGRSAAEATSISATYPTDFRDQEIDAAPVVRRVAQRLQAAFAAGDVATALSLFSFDALYEDAAAHTRLKGQLQIQRYLTRALPAVPYGAGATLAHVEGSRLGGGYEWHAAPTATPMRRGHTALELDADGLITRFTTVYNSGLLSYPAYQALVLLAAEGPL